MIRFSARAWVETADNDMWWDQPCGTGPYSCVENVAGSHATFQLREDYWDKENTPEAETISVRFYTEKTTMFIDYENGVLDAVFSIGNDDVVRLQNGEVDHSNLVIAPKHDTFMIMLPEYVEAFDNIRVRQAVAHVIDMSGVCKVAFGQTAIPSQSTLPKTLSQSIDVGGAYEYNPDYSRQLLEEAGYSDGDITFAIICVNDFQSVKTAEAVQAYLAEVGISVTVESYDNPTAVPMIMAQESDLVIKSVPAGATVKDPQQIYDTMGESSTNGGIRINDPEFNAYLNTAMSTIDAEERAEAYAGAQRWLYDDNYRALTVCDVAEAYVYRDYIASLDVNAPTFPELRYITFIK